MIEYNEPEKEIDYDENELTNDIKRKTILGIKFLLVLSLSTLIITLIWSILK